MYPTGKEHNLFTAEFMRVAPIREDLFTLVGRFCFFFCQKAVVRGDSDDFKFPAFERVA